MQERSEAERRAIMAMPQCCYLAKGAKRPSHTTNTIKFDRIPFDPSNSIKRFDLCPFDQKNSTCLQPPFFDIRSVAKYKKMKGGIFGDKKKMRKKSQSRNNMHKKFWSRTRLEPTSFCLANLE